MMVSCELPLLFGVSDTSSAHLTSLLASSHPSLLPQVLVSAAEAAEMVLRVDDIVKCAPRQRQQV